MTGNIKIVLKQQKKALSVEAYKEWLQNKLNQHGIDRARMIAVVIVIERSLGSELYRSGSQRKRPYYKLWGDDGKPTRAWVHAAELCLWLKYNGFKADPYVHAVAVHPKVHRFIANKDKKNQIPLNVLFPSARKSNVRMRDYIDHFKAWQFKH